MEVCFQFISVQEGSSTGLYSMLLFSFMLVGLILLIIVQTSFLK